MLSVEKEKYLKVSFQRTGYGGNPQQRFKENHLGADGRKLPVNVSHSVVLRYRIEYTVLEKITVGGTANSLRPILGEVFLFAKI